MLINVDKISKSFQSTEVFIEASMIIKENEKIAIVGPNGSGKTTLLKIITQDIDCDSGRLLKSEKLAIGYLQQMAFKDETQTVYEIFEKVYETINKISNKIKQLEYKLKNNPEDEQALDLYARLTNEFEMLGGYFIQSQMETVVSKMGFTKEDMHKKIEHFSGGQKTRLALARLLLSYPDILILDEPTNHLDLSMIEWLESFLMSYPKAVLFVSHDRKFIDRVAKAIVAIEDKKLVRYVGDYSTYVKLAKTKIEKQTKAYAQQQKEIERLEALIEKFRYKKNKAAFAQSKIKYLDKMEKIQKPKQSKQSFSVLFEPRLRGAKEVLVLDQVTIGYDQPLATITCSIFKQQKIAIVGGNGVGKSTLLKSIAGEIPLLGGEMILGHQIEIGYFDQQLAQLNSNKTVLEEVWDDFDQLDKTEIRTVLGRFLFTQDDVFKQVSDCSGGEKVRLTLAKLMLKKANFLVLDEPTNHLDIEAKEALEDSLKAYSGTLLFVSHDRYFVEAVADTMWYFEEHGLVIEKKDESVLTLDQRKELKKQEEKELIIKQRLKKKDIQKQIKRVEKQITQKEDELEQLREKRFDPDYYHDYLKMNELNDTIDDKHNEISRLINEWETLQEELNEENDDENI